MQQELKLRIVSGLILAVIVLAATWYGGFAFRILAAVIGLLIYYEWSTITGVARDWVANAVGWIGQAAIAFLVLVGNFEFAAGMLAGVTAVGIALIILHGTSRWLPVGLFYAGATGLALAAIRSDDRPGLYAMRSLGGDLRQGAGRSRPPAYPHHPVVQSARGLCDGRRTVLPGSIASGRHFAG